MLAGVNRRVQGRPAKRLSGGAQRRPLQPPCKQLAPAGFAAACNPHAAERLDE
jgi:hypothetical protein